MHTVYFGLLKIKENYGSFFFRSRQENDDGITYIPYEPRHMKTNILHMRKQRRRSASR